MKSPSVSIWPSAAHQSANLLPLRTRNAGLTTEEPSKQRNWRATWPAGRRQDRTKEMSRQMVILAPFHPGGECPSSLSLSLAPSLSSALALYEYVQISISNAINGAKADGCVLVLSIVTHTPRCTSE